MSAADSNSWFTPREPALDLACIANDAGIRISVLPNGCLFGIEHRNDAVAVLVNQVLASPIDGGIGRMLFRVGGMRPATFEAVGGRANVALGLGDDRVVWEGGTLGVRHRVTLRLLRDRPAWLWDVEVENERDRAVPIDAILMQDLGLGLRAFVTNNEAYASQYIDHHVARHPSCGPVVMSRQNLAQDGRHPWLMQGCLDGACAFATDALQLFGPAHRDANGIRLGYGTPLADRRLQHEAACVALQSLPVVLEPAARARWRFFAVFSADHSAASSDADLRALDAVPWPNPDDRRVATRTASRSLLQDAECVEVRSSSDAELTRRYGQRTLEELRDGRRLSFFVPDPPHNRHVVMRDKERTVTRRHGAVLRSGRAMLPDASTLSATCWMHGVFAAQLTIGNTSFHKLFSVSRDPYNVTRASGLRAMVDTGSGFRLLTVPSAFEMGLSDCRWIYELDDRTITVRVVASGDDPALSWRLTIDGPACALLVFGHLVLGEREFEHEGRVRVDTRARRFTFRPDPASLWGQRYPEATYHLVTGTPDVIEAVGGDELLFEDGARRSGAYAVVKTRPARELCLAVVGSLTDPAEAERLASKYERTRDDAELLAGATAFWTHVTRGARIEGRGRDAAALDAWLPWLAHDAMIHLSVPRGLEQYTAAAWGTRDVCQGPVEFLLALEHDEPVRDILRTVFARQYASRGDWPQWFMLEPYAGIEDRHSHGDVIVWPLKALNDYLEATGDLAFLDEPISWRDDETLERTRHADAIAVHVDKLLATIRERFIPGTHLIRYGEGDWNDALQPADPALRDAMVSSWTVALLYQQLVRHADVLRRAGRRDATEAISALAGGMRDDFNRFLVREDTVAGYAIFTPGSDVPELLLHPTDVRTGLRYSLLPMTRSIIGGLFTPRQARHHLRLVREHLLFADGAHLIDRPVAYRGGIERTFRRAESAAFFGREIGLMYVHAHLRYGEAMAALGEAEALWHALQVANPVSVTEHVAHATPRQRNAYFSSSDAAFPDRYLASAEWSRARDGTIGVEGGWRIYSSGPGLYVGLLVGRAFGKRRVFGRRIDEPLLPAGEDARIEFRSVARR